GDELIAEERGFPLLRLGATTIDKWGLDGADARYLAARIRGDGVYRLHGTLGTARLIAMQSFTMAGGFQAFDSMSGEAFGADADRRVDLRISATRPEGWTGPWLRLAPAATNLLVREYFNDWEREEVSRLVLERLDAPEPRTGDPAAGRLARIAAAFGGRAALWLPRAAQTREHLVNRFTRPPNQASQGLKDNVYGQGWFQVPEGSALVIELDAPDALLWSFQLGNTWWESLDYVNHTGSLNGHQAVASSDGRYRLVISQEDPGVPNWLDPSGHPEGMVLYRYQQARNAPVPKARRVPLAELRQTLPEDTPEVTPQQRALEIARRREHASRRWSP
ncbi:MAG: hypothetical protein CL910_09735, partial [Deltaproteobacteria bacterium]|nr:hypothetical protein [Deltaproteobacteria bacterium]